MSSEPASSTREAILDAAARLFAGRGPGVRLEDVAEQAGVSRQTVYLHFGSRTGLMIAIVQHIDTREPLPSLVQAVFDAATPLDALDAIVTLHAEYHPVIYGVAKIFMTSRHSDEALAAAWQDRMASRRNLYHEIVDSLHRKGLLDPAWDVETATDIVWTVTSWEVWEHLTVDRGWPKEDYLRHIRSLLRRTLLARDEGERAVRSAGRESRHATRSPR